MEHNHHQHHQNHTQESSAMQHNHSKPGNVEQKHQHDKHAGHHTEDFLKRFWICLVLTVPVLLLSEMIQHWLNTQISFPGSKYVLLGLSSVVFFYGGWPFLKGLVDELKDRTPGMMTLIGFAISVAYILFTCKSDN